MNINYDYYPYILLLWCEIWKLYSGGKYTFE